VKVIKHLVIRCIICMQCGQIYGDKLPSVTTCCCEQLVGDRSVATQRLIDEGNLLKRDVDYCYKLLLLHCVSKNLPRSYFNYNFVDPESVLIIFRNMLLEKRAL